jgi:hypothetical protein
VTSSGRDCSTWKNCKNTCIGTAHCCVYIWTRSTAWPRRKWSDVEDLLGSVGYPTGISVCHRGARLDLVPKTGPYTRLNDQSLHVSSLSPRCNDTRWTCIQSQRDRRGLERTVSKPSQYMHFPCHSHPRRCSSPVWACRCCGSGHQQSTYSEPT